MQGGEREERKGNACERKEGREEEGKRRGREGTPVCIFKFSLE